MRIEIALTVDAKTPNILYTALKKKQFDRTPDIEFEHQLFAYHPGLRLCHGGSAAGSSPASPREDLFLPPSYLGFDEHLRHGVEDHKR